MSFVPPIPTKTIANDVARAQVVRVAKYQRWVLLSLLANIVVLILTMLISFEVLQVSDAARAAFGYVCMAIATLMIISAFQLSNQFFGDLASIVCALLMWLPGVSLIALVIINQKATAFLKGHGIAVGLLGANPAKIKQ
jgi:hypothetical protein